MSQGAVDSIVVEGKYVPDLTDVFRDIFGERGERETIFGDLNFYDPRGPTSERSRSSLIAQGETKPGFWSKLWEDFKRWLSQIWEGLKNAKWGFGMTDAGWMITAGGLTYSKSKNNKKTNPASVNGSILPSGASLAIIIAAIVVFWLVIR